MAALHFLNCVRALLVFVRATQSPTHKRPIYIPKSPEAHQEAQYVYALYVIQFNLLDMYI